MKIFFHEPQDGPGRQALLEAVSRIYAEAALCRLEKAALPPSERERLLDGLIEKISRESEEVLIR